MSRHQLRLLKFALSYPGWHTCGRDSFRPMRALEAKGLVEVRDYANGALPQFRVALPLSAWNAIEAANG